VSRVVIENDLAATGRGRPASAFKRKRIITPSGRLELRTVRPGFRSVLDDLMSGRVQAVLAEDLDRAARDPRDLEDLLDACAERGASARRVRALNDDKFMKSEIARSHSRRRVAARVVAERAAARAAAPAPAGRRESGTGWPELTRNSH